MSNTLLTVENVSKKFCRSLKRSLWYGVKDVGAELIGYGNSHGDLRKEEFWAVKDVSFELKRGETLGLIGPNGAGKTTLLRMLNGLIKPDAGRIEAKGRMQALIALGAGFNPILTGRENIYVNAAVLGILKAEVNRRFDEIVEFSGIEEFIDMPVQSYSSGMIVRLGFAVAAHMDPDILLVDEVLAVGDMMFQAKCLERVSQLCRRGCSVVMVSHNEELMRRVCNRGILLDRGKVVCGGDLHRCFAEYHNLPQGWVGERRRAGNGKIEIADIEFLDENGDSKNHFRMGAALTVRVHLMSRESVEDPALDIAFNSAAGYVAASAHTQYRGYKLGRVEQPTTVEMRFPALNLTPGLYRISALVCGQDLLEIYDWRRNSWEIVIENGFYVRGAAWLPFEFSGVQLSRVDGVK